MVEELETRKLSARTDKEARHKAAIMDKSPSSTIRHSCVIQDNSEEPQTLVAYFSNHPDSDGVEVRDGFKDFEVRRFVNVTQQAISELSLKSPESNGDVDSCTETVGVRHDCECWFEQRHNVTVLLRCYPFTFHLIILQHNNLVPSTDLLQTGSAHKAQAAICYSINVDQQSSLLNVYVKRFFPQEYATLNQVAAAGRWIPEKTSCFLGLATVWKANVNIHLDEHDWKICALTCGGNFVGGRLHLPDLNLSLECAPIRL
ncbi:uncharacterized protein ARMOST_11526 [Armillaria ostoyae]|uniref:Uncharacterized protein n=1 Tax=Armillaria ostoyae TaxID=47428 RepID=A0A284RHC8_ARMOS|nr:uncharacterized protein ARMOST_11526 [Armillaria ostoyae]